MMLKPSRKSDKGSRAKRSVITICFAGCASAPSSWLSTALCCLLQAKAVSVLAQAFYKYSRIVSIVGLDMWLYAQARAKARREAEKEKLAKQASKRKASAVDKFKRSAKKALPEDSESDDSSDDASSSSSDSD